MFTHNSLSSQITSSFLMSAGTLLSSFSVRGREKWYARLATRRRSFVPREGITTCHILVTNMYIIIRSIAANRQRVTILESKEWI